MYSAIAHKKDIPKRKTRIFQFKKEENGEPLKNPTRTIPVVNISETASEYLVVLATPGLRRENFTIEVAQSVITISAKNETIPLSCVANHCEYDYTDWTRVFVLPADADVIFASAVYQNGELVIRIPRNYTSENQAKATIYVY